MVLAKGAARLRLVRVEGLGFWLPSAKGLQGAVQSKSHGWLHSWLSTQTLNPKPLTHIGMVEGLTLNPERVWTLKKF